MTALAYKVPAHVTTLARLVRAAHPREAFRLWWDDKPIFGVGQEDYKQAEWLAAHLELAWRYDHAHERWHHFDGVRWAVDIENRLPFTVAEMAANGALHTDSEAVRKSLVRLMNMPNIKRALEALSTFPAYSTDGRDWDQNPNLIGCANGIVDLTTGVLRDGRPEDLVTRTTGIEFGSKAFCPTVVRFLKDVFKDREGTEQPEVVDYVLQVLGAALFGHTRPQQFWLMVGPGGAGKGTLMRLVAHVLGGVEQYASTPSPNLYQASRFASGADGRARADLIRLQGRRLAYISEPDGPFNDTMLLAHSGEDNITARPLYSNNEVSFIPTHTIVFSTNNPPAIKEVGTNMRRRLRVIPFVRVFGDHPDTDLGRKLEAESAGFLNILVQFARRYAADPSVLDLANAPAAVQDASRSFIESNDPLAAFIRDCADLGRDQRASFASLFDTYSTWFDRTQQDGDPLSRNQFSEQLTSQYHLASKRIGPSKTITYLGIGLRFAPEALDEAD